MRFAVFASIPLGSVKRAVRMRQSRPQERFGDRGRRGFLKRGGARQYGKPPDDDARRGFAFKLVAGFEQLPPSRR